MRVLLAYTDRERATTLEAALFRAGALGVLRSRPREKVSDAVRRVQPDVVLIDMQRPDREILEELRHVAAEDPRPMVMFVGANDPVFMEEAIQAGVCSYNAVGAEVPDMKPILHAAVAIFGRLRQLQEELRSAKAMLEERAVIERAKAVLIRTRGIPEPDAYRWLRRQAMDRGRRIADVAVELLEQTRGR